MAQEKRVFIADDHEMIIPGLRMLVESTGRYRVIGEATDGRTGLELIEKLKPDIAILDMALPGMTGYEIARGIKEKQISTAVLFLTAFSDDRFVREAIEVGASGYLLKDDPPMDLIRALDTIAEGCKYLTPRIMTRIVDSINEREETGSHRDENLTSREREIVGLISRGLRGKEICSELKLSESTLKTHKARIMKKLGVSSTNEIIIWALEGGAPRDVSGD